MSGQQQQQQQQQHQHAAGNSGSHEHVSHEDAPPGTVRKRLGFLNRLHSVLARVRGPDGASASPNKGAARTSHALISSRTPTHGANGAADKDGEAAKRVVGGRQLHQMLQPHEKESLHVTDRRILAHALAQLDQSRPLMQRLEVLDELSELVRIYKFADLPALWVFIPPCLSQPPLCPYPALLHSLTPSIVPA
jgi:hypothetical protein